MPVRFYLDLYFSLLFFVGFISSALMWAEIQSCFYFADSVVFAFVYSLDCFLFVRQFVAYIVET